jgi:hypothetical protein
MENNDFMTDTDWPAYHTEPLIILVGDTPNTARYVTLPPGSYEDDMQLLCELGIVKAVEEVA